MSDLVAITISAILIPEASLCHHRMRETYDITVLNLSSSVPYLGECTQFP